jgi:hypothetical protein
MDEIKIIFESFFTIEIYSSLNLFLICFKKLELKAFNFLIF